MEDRHEHKETDGSSDRNPGNTRRDPRVARVESAFKALSDAVVLADQDRRIVYVNPAFTELFGYSLEEVLGKHTKIIYVSEEAYEEQGRIRFNLSAEEKHRPYEVDYRKKSGAVFPSETVGTVLKDEDDAFIGFVGIIRDISERRALEGELRESLLSLEERVRQRTASLEDSSRKLMREVAERMQTEDELRKSEEKFRSLYMAMNEGVCVHDLVCDESGKAVNYRIVNVNPAYERILDIPATEAVGKLGNEVYGSEEPPYLDMFSAVAVSGKSDYFETYFPPMDKHFGISVFSPKPGSFVTVFSDISKRKRDEQALNETMAQLAREKARAESLLGAIGDGISIQDREFRILYQNGVHREMMGDHQGRLCHEAYEGRGEVCEGCPVALTFADGEIHVVEREVASGEDVRHFEITTSPLKDADGNVVAGIEMVREITERKRAMEDRVAFERQMQHVQKLESLGVLAGGIAHDFNNILMAILGNADLALAQMSPVAPGRSNIVAIEKAARRAADLCQQMLAYSGKGKFVLEAVDLSELVREMHHMLEVSVSKSAIVKYNLGGNLPRIEADPTQIRQIIMNLIINASEALEDRSGVVAIHTGAMDCDRAYLSDIDLDAKLPEGRYAYLEVADTGVGMNDEVVERLFDPFFTTKFTGRGLGMSAVLGIVKGHRGAVRVYSEQGQGTTIKILFPALAENPADGSPQEPAQVRQPRPGSGTVLLVDDEEAVLDVTGEMLKHLGYSVIAAKDGGDALDIFREQSDAISCVLLDLTMPHMDGEETFRELRRIDPDVRVILSSGYNEQDVTQQFVGKGLAGFIQKPYQLVPLSMKLEEVLSGSRPPETDP